MRKETPISEPCSGAFGVCFKHDAMKVDCHERRLRELPPQKHFACSCIAEVIQAFEQIIKFDETDDCHTDSSGGWQSTELMLAFNNCKKVLATIKATHK